MSYIGPQFYSYMKKGPIKLEEIDLYKNDVHSMGIVFLYIEVPEITIREINVTIKGQTENDSDTFLFNTKVPKKSYDLVKDVTNGEIIFEMLKFDQDERISSS